MSRIFSTLSFVAASTLLVVGIAKGPAVASAASSVMSEPFWRCPSGYAFETSGSAVHCKKPAYTSTKAFMPCDPQGRPARQHRHVCREHWRDGHGRTRVLSDRHRRRIHEADRER